MKKRRFLCSLLCILLLAGCSAHLYDEADMTGKTSLEIEQTYGAFDCVTVPAGADGLYRNARCGYTIREPETGFFGTTDERLFFISFDQNGVAVSCEEGYRPGG